MNRYLVAATIGAGMIFVTGPASAAPINPAGPQTISPHLSVEQIYYRQYNNAAVPEAIVGGIVSGVIGGALGGSCYYNDCGYGDGYYGGGGGYRGGRGGVGRVGGVGHINVSRAGGGGHGRR